MIYKYRIAAFPIIFCAFLGTAHADTKTVSVTETSTSGKLVRITAGEGSGLHVGDPVLFSSDNQKLAAGRVVKTDDNSTVVAIMDRYSNDSAVTIGSYDILYGVPFDEADNLPDYVADRDNRPDNPSNEKFFTPEGNELEPELGDDSYTPETVLRPKFPENKTYSAHNITIGLEFFRNRALSTPQADAGTSYNTYQGYGLRYAYTFRTYYWLKQRSAALMSVEFMLGMYTFGHNFPSGRSTDVRVMPIGFNLRYLVEASKLFRIYPYIGYQNNIASADKVAHKSSTDTEDVGPLKGGRILGGVGAQLVMSDAIDSRLEAGSNGVLAGIVVKF